MVENESTHKCCSSRNQGFWHLNKAIFIDAFQQLFRKEFQEGFTLVKEHPLENFVDEVVSVDAVGVCRGVLLDTSHLLQI